MYDIFDEEYIRKTWEKEIREEGFKEGFREGCEEIINNMIAVLREAGTNEDMIRDIAEMSRKQFNLSQ